MFKLAHPKLHAKSKSLLIQQFKQVISRKDRKEINRQMFYYEMHDKKPEWEMIQKYLKLRDIEKDEETGSDISVESDPKEVIINLGRGSGGNQRYGEARPAFIDYSNRGRRENARYEGRAGMCRSSRVRGGARNFFTD